ncbi:MAG TPA: FKBP-type peptidyl-prolyl cis-trans isomerase [Chitinophagaceae bacterium]|nr:FKBP-type peptidyl-prolyl cis-trans isomerase [Chitinophagaceae bacterium]
MKYRILFFCVLCSVMATAQTKPKPKTTPSKSTAAKSAASNTPVLKTALDSFSYAMGMSVGNFCNQQGIASINTSMLLKGVGDGSKPGKALLNEQQMNQVISSYLGKRNAEKASAAKAAGEKFLAENAKKAGVVTLPSGMQYMVLKAGTDTTKPRITDKVKCHYHGTLLDGTVFDSSVDRGEPAVFGVNQVIQGWIEALQMMTVGSKWRLFVPSNLAYGDQQAGPHIAPGSTLIFDVELLEIVK